MLGVGLRIVFFGEAGQALNVMAGAFIYLAPIAVSAFTVYLAERRGRQSWKYYLVAGALSNVLFVLGTLLIMIEGLICTIVIVPLFAIIGAFAGLLMGLACRLTQWSKQTTYCLAMLPIVVGVLPQGELQSRVQSIERSTLIPAHREAVWAQIMNIEGIQPDEVGSAIAFRIGVPTPRAAQTAGTAFPSVRRITMGKQVYFDQVPIAYREHEYIRWRQHFYADSFPPGSFDQHVVMGGPHFDLDEVEYSLREAPGGTHLTLKMRYRVSTHFNWYADGVARLLLGNLQEHLLDLYRKRLASIPSPPHGLEPSL